VTIVHLEKGHTVVSANHLNRRVIKIYATSDMDWKYGKARRSCTVISAVTMGKSSGSATNVIFSCATSVMRKGKCRMKIEAEIKKSLK
jgi:hypothetical protein